MKSPKYTCTVCSIDVMSKGHNYMLRNRVWREAVGKLPCPAQYLCVPCLENCLGRKLDYKDFKVCPMNMEISTPIKHSYVLRNRLRGFDKENAVVLMYIMDRTYKQRRAPWPPEHKNP